MTPLQRVAEYLYAAGWRSSEAALWRDPHTYDWIEPREALLLQAQRDHDELVTGNRAPRIHRIGGSA